MTPVSPLIRRQSRSLWHFHGVGPGLVGLGFHDMTCMVFEIDEGAEIHAYSMTYISIY